ncbi:hypothetical protein BP6252_08143 [Coleophoma cylindrospora]|uniref:Uncharacterized protein n=1 Tax=Coleophoma cylindrospora TaxID=1849047 RepID=A0A3D8RC71_9HELO|nr:hypothetical protein BP6252_08143 [Coleophoma cylindrospora]
MDSFDVTRRPSPWRKSILITIWVVQLSVLSVFTVLICVSLGLNVEESVPLDRQGVPEWTIVNLGIAIITLFMIGFEVVVYTSRDLQPHYFLFFSIFKTFVWSTPLALNIVAVVTQEGWGVWLYSVIAIAFNGVLYISFLGNLFYASITFHHCHLDAKYHKETYLSRPPSITLTETDSSITKTIYNHISIVSQTDAANPETTQPDRPTTPDVSASQKLLSSIPESAESPTDPEHSRRSSEEAPRIPPRSPSRMRPISADSNSQSQSAVEGEERASTLYDPPRRTDTLREREMDEHMLTAGVSMYPTSPDDYQALARAESEAVWSWSEWRRTGNGDVHELHSP